MTGDDPLDGILEEDRRYDRGAYEFVREALHHTVTGLGATRHVSARELLAGIRAVAAAQFGPLARTVFKHWGVETTEDFGNVVFNLVKAGELGRNEDDDPADFAGVYDFADAFPEESGDVRIAPDDDEDDD